MRGLGRLIALPWLLLALALQGLAPAQAEAMPRDAFGSPICSMQSQGAGRHHAPADGHAHDCCAVACALAALDIPAPAQTNVWRVAFAEPAAFGGTQQDALLSRRIDRPPNARAPPASSRTI